MRRSGPAHPGELAQAAELRELPVNFPRRPDEARARIGLYRMRMEEGFAVLRDSDLGRKLPTVFVPEGETVLAISGTWSITSTSFSPI